MSEEIRNRFEILSDLVEARKQIYDLEKEIERLRAIIQVDIDQHQSRYEMLKQKKTLYPGWSLSPGEVCEYHKSCVWYLEQALKGYTDSTTGEPSDLKRHVRED